ncbi:hypothetical protein P3T76_006772 [Phytophthora citrophthora]|uniref:Uncharacterized protein n=1 Tax=Phytophthora citrophthora TaxID=4793 RepID=A0AAD9LLU4_9STRA|nr:hypothetical protein P3T76_006772 [Phytophthora citrophthora]
MLRFDSRNSEVLSRKCHVLESIYEEVDDSSNIDEEEAFVLLESILEDDEPINQDILLHKQHRPEVVDLLEMKKLENAAFTLLEMVLDDDDEPIDEEILFPIHKRNQICNFYPQEMGVDQAEFAHKSR